MKKRLIWLLGIGLTLMIVPFIINKYSIFRVISLVIGVILIEVCFCLKKKRNIFLVILIPVLLFTMSYGVDVLLAFKLKYVPIYSYVIKSSDKMKTYIYPENLRATVKLWFWNVRDFIVICGGIILSVIVFVNLWNVLPIAATVCYGFLSLRVDDTAIMDYIFNAVKFFVTSQQVYSWRKL